MKSSVTVVKYFTLDDKKNILLKTNGIFKVCFFIQFNVPFKIISLIETGKSVWVGGGGRNGSTTGKTPDTPASRTWLVSHVASAGLEPTPDTAVR